MPAKKSNIFNVAPQRILIIDDNQDFLDIFSTKLRMEGFEVATAKSGVGGIEAAKQFKPDLILLDFEMPGMNGVETLSKLKEDPLTSGFRVCFLTMYGESQKDISWTDEKFAREAGAMDFIKKGDDLGAVVGEVKKILK